MELKNALFSITLLFLISLTWDSKATINSSQDPLHILQTPDKPLQNYSNVYDAIIAYYTKKYAGEIEPYVDTDFEINDRDSIIEIFFFQNFGSQTPLKGIYISKKSDINLYGANPVLYGDLNGNGIDDLVVSVQNEGGGNQYRQDIFVFISNGSHFQFVTVHRDWIFARPETCSFRAKQIRNGKIKGQFTCLKDTDPLSRPSEIRAGYLILKNNELVKGD